MKYVSQKYAIMGKALLVPAMGKISLSGVPFSIKTIDESFL